MYYDGMLPGRPKPGAHLCWPPIIVYRLLQTIQIKKRKTKTKEKFKCLSVYVDVVFRRNCSEKKKI